MKDRIPGAPGRHKAQISASELKKMNNGDAFYIQLQRDDQPIEEGTPYSKAAVLPDSVARTVCPENSNPTPADALMALANLAKWAGGFNLLKNSDFRHPVNQRGKTTYSSGYSIDRWKAAENLNVTVKSGYILLECTSSSSRNGLTQYLDPEQIPSAGQVVTLACQTKDGELYIGSAQWPGSGNVFAFGSSSGFAGRINTDSVSFMVSPGEPMQLAWSALWVGEYTADNAPEYFSADPAHNLLECQRYYLNLKTVSGYGYTYNSETAYVTIVLPVQMRITPSMIISSDLYFTIRCGGQKYENVRPGMNIYMSGNQIRFALNISDLGITANQAIHVIKTSGTLAFDAEL